jgi:small neutral amino acid transporter SnatA (MarC family)
MVATLGSNGARIAARLSAFLLLCIAVEIVLQGLRGALG